MVPTGVALELPVSRTFLSDAVRVSVMTRRLPASASFRKLPMSHQVALLGARDPDKVERLATRAVEHKMSVRKVRTLVRGPIRGADGATEAPAPAGARVRRALEGALRALRDEETRRLVFRRADVEDLDDRQAREARKLFAELEKRVADARRLLAEPDAR